MSGLLKLNINDLVKGLVVAVLSSVLSVVYTALQNGGAIDWAFVGNAALVATVSYILKQLGTDQDGKLVGKIDVHSKP